FPSVKKKNISNTLVQGQLILIVISKRIEIKAIIFSFYLSIDQIGGLIIKMRPKSLAITFAHCPLLWINGDSLTQPILMRFDKYLIRQQHPDKFALILKLCNFKFVELLNAIVIIVNPSVGTLA